MEVGVLNWAILSSVPHAAAFSTVSSKAVLTGVPTVEVEDEE